MPTGQETMSTDRGAKLEETMRCIIIRYMHELYMNTYDLPYQNQGNNP